MILPTLAGFVSGRDIQARRDAGLIDQAAYDEQRAARAQDTQRLNEALSAAGFPSDPIGFLLSTPCALGVINQEDLTGETDQQNLPGSTAEYPNWRRKMKIAVEDFGPIAERLGAALAASGRSNNPALPNRAHQRADRFSRSRTVLSARQADKLTLSNAWRAGERIFTPSKARLVS